MTTQPLKEEQIIWFVFQNGLLMLPKKHPSHLLTNAQLSSFNKPFQRQYKFSQQENFIFHCVELHTDDHVPEGFELFPLRKAMEMLGTDWYHLVVKAFTIINWDKTHQFCGHCGYPTQYNPKMFPSFERQCTACSLLFYPRISPTIIVRIQKNDHLLMARSPHFPKGIYALIAGFVEPGEGIEDAVHREVKEEVGISIKNLQYFGSQPWPFPDSLMIAFTAEYASGELTINQTEIEEAGWYHVNHLPGRPSSKLSIASKLIDDFIEQHIKR